MNQIQFKNVKKKISKKQLKQLYKIIKIENRSSILAKLSFKNIKNYINQIIFSDKLDLFVILKDKEIIGYAIVTKKPIYLTKNFKQFQISFVLDLFFNFRIITIINLFFFIIDLENILINSKKKKIILNSANLNLLAINKSYQSQGVGKKFLYYIIKIMKLRNNKFITCETDNMKSTKFYIKKLGFKEIGKKVRLPTLTKVLIKKI